MAISDNAQRAYQRLINVHGLPPMAAAGLVGQFMAESGGGLDVGASGDPNLPGGSKGIGQWNRERLAAMRGFRSSHGAADELDRQVDFAASELRGPEGRALRGLLAAQNPHEAASAGIGYERPAGYTSDNPSGGMHFDRRLANTQALLGGALNATGPAPDLGGGVRAKDRADLERLLIEKYPELRVTSRDRDPEHNARVGGAKGSQHLHGTAMDVSMRDIDPARREEIARTARSLGAKGFGYYPKSDSMHFDMRQGNEAFWGSNYSRTSLPGTPEWFQKFASEPGGTSSPTTAVASAPSASPPPGVLAAQGEAPPVQSGTEAFTAAFDKVQTEQAQQQAQAQIQQAQQAAPQPQQQAMQQVGAAPQQQTAAADLMTSLLNRKRVGRIPGPPGGLLA